MAAIETSRDDPNTNKVIFQQPTLKVQELDIYRASQLG